jgi:hypothetical protein
MEQVIGQLKERYPLLAHLRVAAKDSPDQTEPLPLYLGLLLAAMESESKAPCCFILPRREKSAHLSAVVFALTKFMEDYHRLDRKIAETKFSKDQKVFVRPPNKIYRYLGIYEDNSSLIKLGILGKTDWQTFPLSDVRRLEATDGINPAGKLGNIPALAKETPFDRLLEVNTAGNYGAFLNHVLLLDYQREFEDVASNTHLQKIKPIADMPPLGELMPMGSISQPEDGGSVRLKKWNFLGYKCDPLIAVTSSQEKMVAACRAAEPRSKVVVVNGLGLLASQPQAYDEIAETQRLVIIAEHDEQEQMQALAGRGCKFWWLGQREILMGIGNEASDETPARVFGPVFRSARNEAKIEVESEVCEDQILNDIAIQLVSIDEAVKADETGTTRSIVSRAYKLLNDVASLFQTPTRDESLRFADQLSVIRRELERDRHWVGKSAATIAGICRLFDAIFSTAYRLGDTKGDLLLKTFRNMRGTTEQQTAILARNNSQVKQLENWSSRFGFGARVFTSSTVPKDGSFDCVVCAAWPGGDAFQRMARRFLAPRIKVIGYAFENNWLRQCHRKLCQRPHLPAFSQTEKSELMKNGKAVRIVWPEEPENKESETRPAAPDFTIWAFENRIRSVRKGGAVSSLITEETIAAKYVGFRGDSYAYITEAHRLPIVTDLLGAQEGTNQKTPMKEIEQVRVGDFAVFRDGGNRDVIQVIADQQIQRGGQDAAMLRKRANLWVEALRSTGLKAEQILAQLSKFGPGKNLPTIRNWLSNDSIIGPGLRTDLDSIAKLTKSQELEKSKDAVWAAIKQIRGAHLGAGMRLTRVLLQKLPSCLGEIEESGTKINIEDVVTAWVVQVEDISPQFEQFPRSSVNHLLWESADDSTDLLL